MRHSMPRISTIAAGLLLIGAPVFAQDPKALEVLRRADAATKAVKACSYDAEFSSDGGTTLRVSNIRGTVKLRDGRVGFIQRLAGKDAKRTPSIRADLTIQLHDEEGQKRLCIASDGRLVTFIDEKEKYYLTQALPVGEPMLDAAKSLEMIEFLHPTPFSDELNGREQKHEGTKEIGGVECDVVYVRYQQEGIEARWYFGREDHLPRRVDRIFTMRNFKGTRTLTLSNLDATPSMCESDFRPDCPPGFEKRSLNDRWRSQHLPVGKPAPNWELKTPDGRVVSLKQLRGKVVVVQFWSTWCTFCRHAMPEVQKLNERYQERGVVMVGINCWDEHGKPAEFAKMMNLSFDVLVGGDKVAEEYLVTGLPTFYVIGVDGNIVHAGSGADHHQALSKPIEAALKAADKSGE